MIVNVLVSKSNNTGKLMVVVVRDSTVVHSTECDTTTNLDTLLRVGRRHAKHGDDVVCSLTYRAVADVTGRAAASYKD